MAALDITHVGSGAWSAGGAAPAPTWPAVTIEAGDKVYALIHSRESTVQLPATHGTTWTRVYEAVIGSGTVGAGTGPTRFTVYERDATGGESGTYSFSSLGTTAALASIHVFRAPAGATGLTWSTAFSSYSHASSTNIGGSTGTLALAAKDVLLIGHGSPDDTTTSLPLSSVSASGMTFGSITTASATTVSGTGNDHAAAAYVVPITAGSATVAVTLAGTANAAETGGSIVLRIRLDGTAGGGGGGDFPNLVASYTDQETASNLTALTTPSFTPADGELIVVKASGSDNVLSWNNLPTGGSLTFESITDIPGSSQCPARIWAVKVGTSPGSMSVSLTPTGSGVPHSFVVERWSNAKLDATPAVNATESGTGAPSATLTTEANSSIVSWVCADWNANAPGTPAYRSSATQEFVADVSTSFYVAYYAYQQAASAGSQTIGMTAPTGQKWSMLGVEIQYEAPAGGTGEITPRTATVVGTTTASIAPDMSTAQLGDCALLTVAADVTISTPTGWTPCFTQINQVVDFAAFYRFLNGGADDSPTVSAPSATRLTAIVQPFGGVDTTTPLDATPVTSNGAAAASINISGLTTVTDGALAVSGAAIDASAATQAFTLSWTGGTEVMQTTGTGRRQEVAQKPMPTAGATGTATWTQGGGTSLHMVGFQLALRPAPATEPPVDTTDFFLAAA